MVLRLALVWVDDRFIQESRTQLVSIANQLKFTRSTTTNPLNQFGIN